MVGVQPPLQRGHRLAEPGDRVPAPGVTERQVRDVAEQ
jgi:hypothetical protein